ncbi:MAG: YceI family protein [Burkholderiales bacterium]
MTTRSISSITARPAVLLAAILATAATVALLSSAPAQAARYEIDPAATKTTYLTKYLGFIPVRGVFTRMTGVLNYQPTKPVVEREPSIHVIIDATTLTPTNFDSESKRRMLRGPEFFNVDRFPTIEFKSMRFRYEGDKLVAIDGTITLVGVTKPVTLTVMKSGCEPASSSKAARCTASTELTVKRFEFGMKGWSGTVSDEVMIAVELVATILGEEKPMPPVPPVPPVAATVLPTAAPTTAASAAAKENK